MIRLGATPELISQPLLFAILRSQIEHPFQAVTQSPEQNCRALLNRTLDLALITAADYARHNQHLRLVKDFAVSSAGAARCALLFFRESLHHFDSIACFAPDSQYRLLTDLVLNEFYEMETDWQALEPPTSLEQALNLYPACLLEGDAAFDCFLKNERNLDILEEWYDKTSLGYTHQLLAVHQDIEEYDFVDSLGLAREIGLRNLMSIAKAYAEGKENSWDFYFDLINERFQYFPNEETWDYLRQYFEYLFYYGVIDYIPELHFC